MSFLDLGQTIPERRKRKGERQRQSFCLQLLTENYITSGLRRSTSTPCPELEHSLNLFLQYGWIREACCVRNHKVPLVPCRVIPHIIFQEILHKLKLIVPQFVFLERIIVGNMQNMFSIDEMWSSDVILRPNSSALLHLPG